MIVYNALPTAYRSIDDIEKQLPKLENMGVDILWLNPIHYSRRSPHIPGGSLYSMNHEDNFLSAWDGGSVPTNERKLKRLSQEASNKGIALMFDLVMNQVGNKLPYIRKNLHLFSNPHRGAFDFSTQKKRQDIFEGLFKPFIQKYVLDYGFTGMRIDGAYMVPADMQKWAIDYFRQLCTVLDKQSIVLGEYLGSNERLDNLKQAGIQYDLITNSSYYSLNAGPYLATNERGNHNHDMGIRRPLSRMGTIGWTGNHDEKNLALTCYHRYQQNSHKKPSKDTLERMMREQIAVTAFASCGGYYILCGDEYGTLQNRSCFEWERGGIEPAFRDGQTCADNWGGHFDFTSYLADLNAMLKQLPKLDSHFWSELYVLPKDLDEHSNIRCIARFNGQGPFAPLDLMFVNVHPTSSFDLHEGHIKNILEQINHQHSVDMAHHSNINIHASKTIAQTFTRAPFKPRLT